MTGHECRGCRDPRFVLHEYDPATGKIGPPPHTCVNKTPEQIAWEAEVDEVRATVIDLIKRGWLVGISVFGTEGYGLCDQVAFDRRNPGFGPGTESRFVGSDCNRADLFMMRPNDPIMTDEIKALLADQPDGETE